MTRVTLILLAGLAAITAGCEPYRVEYHTRPAFYEKAALGQLPDEVVLADGTIVRYSSSTAQSSMGRKGEDARKPFQIREQMEDGSIVLRAVLPEHVIINTLECLRLEEYELLYDQMLADSTKAAYDAREDGRAECLAFWKKHRHDLVAALTRMAAGMSYQEVSVTPLGEGVTRCRLRPHVAEEFKFTIADIVKEGPGPGLKLLLIRP